jgi:hypothetical protein
MKGTISPQMRALLNNRDLYRKFTSKLFESSPRKPFCVEDDYGNRVCYTPYGQRNTQPKNKRNLLQLLLGM